MPARPSGGAGRRNHDRVVGVGAFICAAKACSPATAADWVGWAGSGQVGRERLGREAGRRHELGDQAVGLHVRDAVDQSGHGGSLPDPMMVR